MTTALGTWAPPEGKRGVSLGSAMKAALGALDEGTTVGTEYYSFRYNFRPESVDTSKPARVDEIDAKPKSDGSRSFRMNSASTQGDDWHTFTGLQQPAKDFECVLIYDEATGTFVLEKLDSAMTLTHSSKGSNPSGNTTVDFEESPASATTLTAASTSPPHAIINTASSIIEDIVMNDVVAPPSRPSKKPIPTPASTSSSGVNGAAPSASKPKPKRPKDGDRTNNTPSMPPRKRRTPTPPPPPPPLMLPPKRPPTPPPRARPPSPDAFRPESNFMFSDDEDEALEDAVPPGNSKAPESPFSLELTVEEYEPDFHSNQRGDAAGGESDEGEQDAEGEMDGDDNSDFLDALEEGDGDGEEDGEGEEGEGDDDDDEFDLGQDLEQALNNGTGAPGQGQLAGKAPMDMSAFTGDDDESDSSEEDSD